MDDRQCKHCGETINESEDMFFRGACAECYAELVLGTIPWVTDGRPGLERCWMSEWQYHGEYYDYHGDRTD